MVGTTVSSVGCTVTTDGPTCTAADVWRDVALVNCRGGGLLLLLVLRKLPECDVLLWFTNSALESADSRRSRGTCTGGEIELPELCGDDFSGDPWSGVVSLLVDICDFFSMTLGGGKDGTLTLKDGIRFSVDGMLIRAGAV